MSVARIAGTSLYYGRVDNEGIACCYHGWKFDVRGRCIDQPMRAQWRRQDEIGDLSALVSDARTIRAGFRLPWGRRPKQPILPRLDILENLNENEKIHPTGPAGFGFGADDTIRAMPLQLAAAVREHDGPVPSDDLHSRHSGVQFSPDLVNMPGGQKFEWTDSRR